MPIAFQQILQILILLSFLVESLCTSIARIVALFSGRFKGDYKVTTKKSLLVFFNLKKFVILKNIPFFS
jgi:hypothetical protein